MRALSAAAAHIGRACSSHTGVGGAHKGAPAQATPLSPQARGSSTGCTPSHRQPMIASGCAGPSMEAAGALCETWVRRPLQAGRAACCCSSVSLNGLGSKPPPVVSRHADVYSTPVDGKQKPEAGMRGPYVRLRHGCGMAAARRTCQHGRRPRAP